MSQDQSSDKSRLLTDLPGYIYGTTRFGDEKLPFDARVRLACAAMEGVRWFHTIHTETPYRCCAPPLTRAGRGSRA